MERRRIGDEGNRSTCVSGPLPRSVYFLIGYSDPVMSKGVEGGGSSAASALQWQRRGFREARRDPRTAVDPQTADVGA